MGKQAHSSDQQQALISLAYVLAGISSVFLIQVIGGATVKWLARYIREPPAYL